MPAIPHTAKTIPSELRRLDAKRYTALRELYYRVADALPRLAESLEDADTYLGGEAGPLLTQYIHVCETLEAFERVELGKYL